MFYTPRALPLNHSEQSRMINWIPPSPFSGRKQVGKEGSKRRMGSCPVSVCERMVMDRKQSFIKYCLLFAFHFTRVATSSPEINGITFHSGQNGERASLPLIVRVTPAASTSQSDCLHYHVECHPLSRSQPLDQSNAISRLLSLARDPFQLILRREVTAVLSKMLDHVPQLLKTTDWTSSSGGWEEIPDPHPAQPGLTCSRCYMLRCYMLRSRWIWHDLPLQSLFSMLFPFTFNSPAASTACSFPLANHSPLSSHLYFLSPFLKPFPQLCGPLLHLTFPDLCSNVHQCLAITLCLHYCFTFSG